MDVRHDIATLVQDGSPAWSTQRDVKDRALLRNIDCLTLKHGLDPAAKIRLCRQLQQQLQCLGGDAVFGIIEIDACGFCAQAFTTVGLLREKLPEMEVLDAVIVGLQQSPS